MDQTTTSAAPVEVEEGANHASLGIPTACFVHLDNGPNPSVTTATTMSENAFGIDGQHYEVHKLFDSNVDQDENVYREMLQGITPQGGGPDRRRTSYLASVVEDAVPLCVLLTGTGRSAKRALYQGYDETGDNESLGMLGWILDSILQLLGEKSSRAQGRGRYGFAASMEFYEIVDEKITDLLNPENQDLAVRLHPARGFEVRGASRAVVTSPRDGRRAIRMCKRNRRNKVSADDPADESGSGSAVFRMNLVQYREVSDDREAPLVSAVTVVDTPCSHVLSCSAHEATCSQGLASKHSLRTLQNVLQDSLGGNAHVLCLACLSRSDSDQVNNATMALVRDLQAAAHYPVVNDGPVQGLTTRYRLMLANALDEAVMLRAKGNVDARMTSREDTEQRIRSLEEQLVQAEIQNDEARGDALKVHEMLGLVKERYIKMAKTKASRSRELIVAEEEKLELIRSLLKLKARHSEQLKKLESERRGLARDLLAAEDEIARLEMRCEMSQGETRRRSHHLRRARWELAETLEEQAAVSRGDCRTMKLKQPGGVGEEGGIGDEHIMANRRRIRENDVMARPTAREERSAEETKKLRHRVRDTTARNWIPGNRYKRLRGILEASRGAGDLPPDVPDNDELLIAVGALATGASEEGSLAAAAPSEEDRGLLPSIAVSELAAERQANTGVTEGYSDGIETRRRRRRRVYGPELGQQLETGNATIRLRLETDRGVQEDLQAMRVMLENMTLKGSSSAAAADSESERRRFRESAGDERGRDLDEASLMLELQRVERRNAELVSSNQHLEAELGGFKTYIRDTVLGYQRTIRQLQSELMQARGGAGYG